MENIQQTIPTLWTRWVEVYLYQSEGETFKEENAARGKR